MLYSGKEPIEPTSSRLSETEPKNTGLSCLAKGIQDSIEPSYCMVTAHCS